MRTLSFARAIDDALAQAMAADPNVVIFGEDAPLLRRELLVRFGAKRVKGAPISESAFLGAGVAAAMSGLRPVVEIYMVDFLGVCLDALLTMPLSSRPSPAGNGRLPWWSACPAAGDTATAASTNSPYGAGWRISRD